MNKREMIEEMIETLNYAGGNDKVVDNCCKSHKARVEKVYRYFQEHKNEQDKIMQHRKFCIMLLMNF